MKNLIILILLTLGVLCASLGFNIWRANLTDVTTIDLFNIGWLWNHKFKLAEIVIIGTVWLSMALYQSQYAHNASQGQQTALYIVVVPAAVLMIFNVLQVIIINMVRGEVILPFSNHYFWSLFIAFVGLSFISSLIGFRIVEMLAGIRS